MTTISIASPLTESLQKVLANTCSLTILTQNAHWNIVGNDFFELHSAFGGQYEALFDFQDELAEQIRQLDGKVKVNAVELFSALGGMPDTFSAREAVITLLNGHEKAINDLVALRNLANKYNDLETQDLAIKVLEFHKKTRWMLKSYLA